jgi:hypothetical protein
MEHVPGIYSDLTHIIYLDILNSLVLISVVAASE